MYANLSYRASPKELSRSKSCKLVHARARPEPEKISTGSAQTPKKIFSLNQTKNNLKAKSGLKNVND